MIEQLYYDLNSENDITNELVLIVFSVMLQFSLYTANYFGIFVPGDLL